MRQEISILLISLTVSESNMGSSGSTDFMAIASTTMKIKVKSTMPIYHFGKALFFEKNKKIVYSHANINAKFIPITPKSIGAHIA